MIRGEEKTRWQFLGKISPLFNLSLWLSERFFFVLGNFKTWSWKGCREATQRLLFWGQYQHGSSLIGLTRYITKMIIELSRMADTKFIGKRWEDMEIDVLVKIFKELNMIELAPVSRVCRSWRLACSDPLIWNTLDLGLLKSNYIQTRAPPYIWVNERSDRRLTQVLRIAMALSRGNVTCMIFHYYLYMKDEHLSYIAERSPNLKRLVMPAWNRITKTGICQAIQRWQKLESLTMPSIAHPPYIMEEISRSCNNFSQLKIMGTFDAHFASAIACNLPKLKVLSVRCSIITREALLLILDSMDHLEVLNISHCLILEGLSSVGRKQVIRELDHSILERASRLREFFHCQSSSCTTCQRMIKDEGLMRWYLCEPCWRNDEVSSLDLGNHGRLFDEGVSKGFPD